MRNALARGARAGQLVAVSAAEALPIIEEVGGARADWRKVVARATDGDCAILVSYVDHVPRLVTFWCRDRATATLTYTLGGLAAKRRRTGGVHATNHCRRALFDVGIREIIAVMERPRPDLEAKAVERGYEVIGRDGGRVTLRWNLTVRPEEP